MEKEIADCLLRGEVPILPLDSFAKDSIPDDPIQTVDSENLSKDKIRKLKRKQFFRRQSLKRKKEKEKIRGTTPSFDFHAYTTSTFSRKNHASHIQSLKEKEELSLEGKSEEELQQIMQDQQKQIEHLTEENNKLHHAIYRIKKQLNIVSTM